MRIVLEPGGTELFINTQKKQLVAGKKKDGSLLNEGELATIWVEYGPELQQEAIRRKYETLLRGAA
jgi:hypothetical protein